MGTPRPLPFLDLVDFLLQEVVERGPKHRNGRELSDLVPGRSDRGAQNIGGEQEFEPERQPTSEAAPDLLLIIIGVTRRRSGDAVSEEGGQSPSRRLDGGKPDDERCDGLRPGCEPQGDRLERFQRFHSAAPCSPEGNEGCRAGFRLGTFQRALANCAHPARSAAGGTRSLPRTAPWLPGGRP